MIGDHDYPAIFIFLFDIIENINAAFTGQINIEHGNLWIQLIDECCGFFIRAGCMETCSIKILWEDRDYPLNIANIIVNNQDQRFQCELIMYQIKPIKFDRV